MKELIAATMAGAVAFGLYVVLIYALDCLAGWLSKSPKRRHDDGSNIS